MHALFHWKQISPAIGNLNVNAGSFSGMELFIQNAFAQGVFKHKSGGVTFVREFVTNEDLLEIDPLLLRRDWIGGDYSILTYCKLYFSLNTKIFRISFRYTAYKSDGSKIIGFKYGR